MSIHTGEAYRCHTSMEYRSNAFSASFRPATFRPAVAGSAVTKIDISTAILLMGAVATLYTTTGGAKAVGVTHKQQMAVMFGGLFIAFYFLVKQIGEHATFSKEAADLLLEIGIIKSIPDLSKLADTRFLK